MKNIKLISTVLVSLMLIFTFSTAVFADNETNDSIWEDVNIVENNTTNDIENESLFENIEDENEANNEIVLEDNEVEEENEYNNLYTTSNSTTSNSENLADTGIEDSSVMALIIIVSAIVAIYSARKFNEYKNV